MSGVRETDIDGVLCFWVDMGRPASCAHLLFRQGLADEPLHESGWLHLLEHLALLDRETLTRPIEGRRPCCAPASPPTAARRPSPSTSAPWRGGWPSPTSGCCRASAACSRPRPRGARPADPLADVALRRPRPGRRRLPEIGAVRATDELLTERARRVFNPANAILVLDGPPPAGLPSLLPAGEYRPGVKAEPISRALPAAYLDDVGLTLSGVVTRTHEAGFLPVLLERALHDGLRRHSGSAFALWSSMVDVDNEYAVVAGGSDVVAEMLPTLAKAALEVSGQLVEHGVPREWVQEAVERRLRRARVARGRGRDRPGGGVRRAERPGTDDLRRAGRAAARHRPDEGRPRGPGAARLPAGRAARRPLPCTGRSRRSRSPSRGPRARGASTATSTGPPI